MYFIRVSYEMHSVNRVVKIFFTSCTSCTPEGTINAVKTIIVSPTATGLAGQAAESASGNWAAKTP